MFLWRKRTNTRWLQVREASLREETGDALAIIESPLRSTVLLEVVSASGEKARALVRIFGGVIEKLPRDWLTVYARAHKIPPLRIGKRLLVTTENFLPGESDLATAQKRLVIPAGAAFGTGDHATTAMSLRLLERFTRQWKNGWSLADLGTGSGILALAAHLLGAGRGLGVDNDPRAVATARANARRNRITKAKFQVADARQWRPAGRMDVVTANLYSELLIETLPHFRRYLAADGLLIASGIMRGQERAVMRALRASAIEPIELRRRGKWIALLARPRP